MDFFLLLLVLIPIYVANSVPVVLGGGPPLDFNKNFFDGRRLLGDGKTIRGFIAGVICGSLAGVFIADFYHVPFFADKKAQVFGAIALSFGTMIGDSLGSFIKRRAGVGNGKPFLLDTVFFLIVALVFAYPFAAPEMYAPENLLFFFGLTVILHPLTNFFANRAGLKNVPW